MSRQGESLWEWAAPAACPVRVQVTASAWRQMHLQVDREADREIGGFLIGRAWSEGKRFRVLVEDVLPVEDAGSTASEFTFKAEAFIHVAHKYGTPDGRVPSGSTWVGWYHTHPGHGVFFSMPDQETHASKFGAPYHIGLVIDPHREEAGLFYWSQPRQFGPVELNQVRGKFHWRTLQPLGRDAAKLPRPPADRQRLAMWGGVSGVVLGVLTGAAIAWHGLTAEAAPPDTASLMPMDQEGRAIRFRLPAGQWTYALSNAQASQPKVILKPLKGEKRRQGEFSFEVPYDEITSNGIEGAAVLWLQRDRAAVMRVDLPEVVTRLDPEAIAIVLQEASGGSGRFYLRYPDAPEQDRVVDYLRR